MKKYSKKDLKLFRKYYADEIEVEINERIESELVYHEDIEKWTNKFANIDMVYKNEYTYDDLFQDMYNDFYEDDDIMKEIVHEVLSIQKNSKIKVSKDDD